MNRFRHKPVEVEAFLWSGGPDQTEDPVWIVDAMKRGHVQIAPGRYCPLEMRIGWVTYACPGDWIVKEPSGAIHPVKTDIFAATYEAAE